MKILLHISFLGTNYCGYQIQKNGKTVQGTLCDAAQKVFGFQCDITGCSRTDSGVHANEFCATVSEHMKECINTTVPTEKIPIAFNSFLPDDIAVISAEEVDDSFHARYSVKYKEYKYLIYNKKMPNPFLADRSLHYPKVFSNGDVKRMNEGAKFLVGKKDFSSYMASGSKITDTVRTIVNAEVFKEGDFVVFKVCADGFLYNMVRILTGTLMEVGENKILPSDIEKITNSHDRRKAGATVSAKGLYLNKVEYADI